MVIDHQPSSILLKVATESDSRELFVGDIWDTTGDHELIQHELAQTGEYWGLICVTVTVGVMEFHQITFLSGYDRFLGAGRVKV